MTNCTLQQYADDKKLPVEFLKSLGVNDANYCNQPAVAIPYFDAENNLVTTQFRIALSGKDKFRWIKGGGTYIYYNNQLREKSDYAVIVEGASDSQTCWYYGINAFGVAGASNWKEEYAALFANYIVIYVIIEPDAGGETVLKWLQESSINNKVKIIKLDGFKDPSDLHCDAPDKFLERWQQALENAIAFDVFILEQQNQFNTLEAVTLHYLLQMQIPPREMLLSPIIQTQGLVMLYAARGIGKTYISLSIALGVATGSAILGERWKAEKAHKVLFVDGEMPAIALQQRLASLVSNNDKELPTPEYLKIITPDMQEFGIPDLATGEGQEAIEQHLEGVELLILDNLSSLCRRGKENEAESWLPVQEWLLSLRKRGISVLLVHHAGKTGAQRGTSKREDLLDTVITLKRPSDYESNQGARFEVHYEKARGFYGDAATPFEAHLQGDDNNQYWAVKDIEDSLLERVKELQSSGLKQREIASEVGCSPAKVNRLLKKARETS